MLSGCFIKFLKQTIHVSGFVGSHWRQLGGHFDKINKTFLTPIKLLIETAALNENVRFEFEWVTLLIVRRFND